MSRKTRFLLSAPIQLSTLNFELALGPIHRLRGICFSHVGAAT